jgi:hypothetical protein
MFDFQYQVTDVRPDRVAATPLLLFRLRVSETLTGDATPTPIHGVSLRCQIRIEPKRRRYGAQAQEKLLDLFGTPERWARTLHPLLWTHAGVHIRSFAGSTEEELPVACSYDFSLAATKYFDALNEGAIPLSFLFSGTVFYEDADGRVQIAQIPWEKEARFAMPARVWHELMEHYYPNSAWLCLHRDVFDQLSEYQRRLGSPTWDETIEVLLAAAKETAAS